MIRDLFHFGLALCLASCSPRPEKLIIATAANVQFAMDGLVKEFASESGIPCEIILGSSGKLTAQIMAGAPYDVFVSADMKYPQELHAAGKTTDKPEVYAYGLLVLWTVREDIEPELDMLNDDRVMHGLARILVRAARVGILGIGIGTDHFWIDSSLSFQSVQRFENWRF